MSWTKRPEPYQEFIDNCKSGPVHGAPWTLKIWEITDKFPGGRWYEEASATCLREKASLRIVFAPVDKTRADVLPQMLELLQTAQIPGEFTNERVQSSSHSFARRSDARGTSSWFHFLCKNIALGYDADGFPVVQGVTASPGFPMSTLPHADYSWIRAGFFVRAQNDGRVLLVCFGAPLRVRTRIEEFVAGGAWEEVAQAPYVLFDLVLEGLYFEVDETLWKMNQRILEYANTKGIHRMSSKIPFAALHTCAKHIIFISEAIESCIMVADALLRHAAETRKTPSGGETKLVRQQLRERLQYRRSLVRATQLRLSSLQQRVANVLTLSFNLVAQQDSMAMIQDSQSMRVIAAITMVFLPITGVATVVGSQLFSVAARRQGGPGDIAWDVDATPLFWVTLWIAIPLTVFVALLAAVFHWWMRWDHPYKRVVRGVQRAATWTTSWSAPNAGSSKADSA